jgi:hypothetical protein
MRSLPASHLVVKISGGAWDMTAPWKPGDGSTPWKDCNHPASGNSGLPGVARWHEPLRNGWECVRMASQGIQPAGGPPMNGPERDPALPETCTFQGTLQRMKMRKPLPAN